MTANDKVHQGRNIKRFREMLGYKQDGLAYLMGDDWSQRRISLLEAKEQVDRPTLELVSKALKIPVEAFENFEEEGAVNYIANTFNTQDNASFGNNTINNVNVTAKWLEALEVNIKQVEEIKALYERLLQTERDKVELLEKIMKSK